MHAIAGVTGNIGATSIGKRARTLSTSLNDPNEKLDVDMLYTEAIELSKEVEKISKSINDALASDTTSANNKNEISKEDLKAILANVKSLIDESDPSAADVLDEAIEKFEFGKHHGAIIKAQIALTEMEFEEAAEHLTTIAIDE